MSLDRTLSGLIVDFTNQLLDAIRAARMAELLGLGVNGPVAQPRRKLSGGAAKPNRGKKPSRPLARRSNAQLQRGLDKVVALLKQAEEPMRAETIQEKLKLDRRELPGLLQRGLKTKVLRKKGERRASAYSVV